MAVIYRRPTTRAPLLLRTVSESLRRRTPFSFSCYSAVATDDNSDERVDSGEVADPRSWSRRPIDADHWKWRADWSTEWQPDEHFTVFEVLTGQLSLVWSTSKRKELEKRVTHLMNNHAALSAQAKSCSLWRRMQGVFRSEASVWRAAEVRRTLARCVTTPSLRSCSVTDVNTLRTFQPDHHERCPGGIRS